MNAPATIFRADSPLARCRHCGVQRQFHGLNAVPINAYDRQRDHGFEAETVEDIEPADLSNRDLIAHCGSVAADYSKLRGCSDDELTESDRLFERVETCRAEIEARLKSVFGVGFDDLRETMGW